MHEPAVTPGGHIFVPAPLFLSAESESEFAGMLAHSMVHAAERHTVRLAPRGPVSTLSDIPMMVVIHRADMSVPLRYVNPLREFELQADRLAMQAMARAGYEPAALFRYVNRVQGEDAQGPNSTVPPREARITNLQQALVALPANERALGSGEFERVRLEMRALLDRMPRRPSLR
jgi:predicted Zn-dependent protease